MGFDKMEENKKKATSAKSMETAKEAGYFGKKMLKNAYKAHQEGRPIAWSMVTWWEGELIANAMGIELVFPENYGALSVLPIICYWTLSVMSFAKYSSTRLLRLWHI